MAAPSPTPPAGLRPRLGRKVLGWALLVLGVAGVVLPILQGTVFLVLALLVLRDQHEWAARRWVWAANRWPGLVGRVEDMERKMTLRLDGAWDRARARLGWTTPGGR